MNVATLRMGILVVLALAYSGQPNADEAQKTSMSITEFNSLVNCDRGSDLGDCVASIHALQSHPKYQNPEAQYQLAQLIKSISGIHPAVLDISYEILTQLLQEDPENIHYKSARAYVKSRQNYIDGICEGRTAGASVLRNMLDNYLKFGRIQNDIKRLSVDAVRESLDRNDYIHLTIDEVRQSIEAISRYGGDDEASVFISDTKGLIPWEEWRPELWKSPSGNSELASRDWKLFFFTYCQPTTLKLDDGAFCEDAVSQMDQEADLERLLKDKEFQELLEWILSEMEELQPAKLVNAVEQLEGMVRNYGEKPGHP